MVMTSPVRLGTESCTHTRTRAHAHSTVKLKESEETEGFKQPVELS